MIFRVFNVDKQSVGLKIYMDPVLLEGIALLFTPEAWSVVPQGGCCDV